MIHFMKLMKLKSIILTFTLLTVMAFIAFFLFYYSSIKKYEIKKNLLLARNHTYTVNLSISQMISRYHRITLSLSLHQELSRCLTDPSEKNLDQANQVLDIYNTSLETNVCYLMDSTGLVVASSNRGSDGSFVGNNYGFREYFKQSVKGDLFAYPAFGVTSKKRGIYFSSPVKRYDSDVIIGVCVIKENVTHLEKEILMHHSAENDIMAVTNQDGIVFISNKNQLLFHSLWKLNDNQIFKLKASRQFGAGPWPWAGYSKQSPKKALTVSGDSYELISEDINGTSGWQLVHLSSTDSLLKEVNTSIYKTFGYTGGLIVLIIGAAIAGLTILAGRAEKTLRESEQRYRSVTHTVQDGIILQAASGEILTWNKGAEKIFGILSSEVIGQIYSEKEWHTIHEDGTKYDGKDHPSMVTLHTGKAITNEIMGILKPSGELKWISINTSPMFNGQEKKAYAVAISFTDITELKQTEQELRDSRKRFKALHNASFGGIAIHDKGVILDCNQGLSEITGYSHDELMGMDGLLLIAPESRDMVMENIVSGYEKPYEAFGLRKNSEKYPLRLEARNIPYMGKQVRAVEFRDITESKQAQKEQERLQAQLTQAMKMESIGRLAGGIAHDFNNMLSIILGNTEILLEDLDVSNPGNENLHEIQNAAQRSAQLTHQLLAFARKQTVVPKVIDLNDIIEGMLTMLRRLIGENIALSWVPAEGLWPIRIDPNQIDQILVNLFVNARDSIKGVGSVIIKTHNSHIDEDYCREHVWARSGNYVVIIVSDNGCGMDKDTIDNLFEPFFTTKKFGEGTGLGLSTVYGIVKQNKGFINVYSEPGEGTSFKIYLPRHIGEQEVSNKTGEKKDIQAGHETILLVEDEEAILKMTTMMLERLGYKVYTAAVPGKALAIANDSTIGNIDLLMTDVVMPEMNGRDLAEKLMQLIPDLKCLFMSGYTADMIAHQGILDKGVNFINKPFAKQALADKLRKIFDNS